MSSDLIASLVSLWFERATTRDRMLRLLTLNNPGAAKQVQDDAKTIAQLNQQINAIQTVFKRG
jgi:hypothetical protein